MGAVVFQNLYIMSSNCKYKVLHKCNIGKISLCNSCGNLRVEIGHLLSLISPEPFQMILEDFKERLAFYKDNPDVEQPSEPILICLNNNNLYLKLTNAEFNEVLHLFEMANHMLYVNQIMTPH